MELPDGYRIRWGGSAEMMNDAVAEMGKAFILAILLLYMLLTAILESFKQPLLIMSTVPMALIGVIFKAYSTTPALTYFWYMFRYIFQIFFFKT